MKDFYHHYMGLCKVLANEHNCWKRMNTITFITSQYVNLGINVLLCSIASYMYVALTWLSEWLKHNYFLLVTLLICCTLKLTVLVFIVLSWSKLYIQNEHTIIEVSDHSDSNSCLSSSAECVEAQAISGSYVEDISIFRSFGDKKAEKELNRNLHKNNEAETSGFLHSSNSQHLSPVTTKHLSPVTTKHLSPTLEAAPKADLLGQQKNSDTK